MAKTPCAFFAKGTCTRGDKCLFMHGEKATPAKEDKRANSPHPKAKPKAKAATTILIENDVGCTFGPPKIETADEEVVVASIREEQLKSCLKGTTTEKKKKELKFSNRVGFVDIEVNKDMKPVGRDQRVYKKKYESSENAHRAPSHRSAALKPRHDSLWISSSSSRNSTAKVQVRVQVAGLQDVQKTAEEA